MQQVFIEKIEQLGSKLNTSWTTSTHDERQQALALIVRSSGETSHFHIFQHLVFDLASIVNRFQEVAVLEALDAVRVRNAAFSDEMSVSAIASVYRHEAFGSSNVPTPTTSLSYGK